MPKNQFQRPQAVNPDRNVPRHGKAAPPAPRPLAKPVRQPPAPDGLPPLDVLLARSDKRR